MNPKVSIIISNRNDVAMLAVTVRSCIEELKPLGKDAGEIVIVDNSDQAIYALLSSALPMGYARGPGKMLKIHYQNFPCLFTAREKAAELASGEYILCVDSHMIIGHNMIYDLVQFMDSKSDDPTLGFAHAPVSWAHQHERGARHDRDMSKCELGDWNRAYNKIQTITWKGMPWICRRNWFLDRDKGLNAYGALAEHKLSWGGGDMHIGIKPWLLGYKNWAVPCSPAIHIGPFPKMDTKKDPNTTIVGDPTLPEYKYRLWSNSGIGPHAIGFLVSCYVLGGEAMMERNKEAIQERFGRYIDQDKWWSKAIEYGKDEKTWLDARKVISFEELLETEPWNPNKPKKPKPVKIEPSTGLKYSVVIPYMHSEERLPLLRACLDSLSRISGLEVCVHEIGPSKTLSLSGKYKYLFTEFKGVFHRAWAINRGAKLLATGDILILMDGDIVVTEDWAKSVLFCDELSVGWNKLHLLSKTGTEEFLKTGNISKDKVERTKTPSMGSAAGGITVVSSKLFHSVKGIPEDFAGSWGGEDNAFWAKMRSLGHKIARAGGEVYHLHHSRSTPRIRNIQRKALTMIQWKRHQWDEHMRLIDTQWGVANPNEADYPSTSYISTVESPRLTLAMLSWLRVDKLLETLASLEETLTIPINLTLQVQGAERLDEATKRKIRNAAAKFHCRDVYFTTGNKGTGPCRKTLVERALNRFNSPYINLADDDTYYTPGSVEAALDLLDREPSIGIVGIRYKPKVYVLDSHTNPTKLGPKDARFDLEYVDSTGSASAFMRRDIFDTCVIDPSYIIGQWDLDLCLQARAVGWKIANYVAFPEMKAINNWGGNREYKAARRNRQAIAHSKGRMLKKWGLKRAV